MEGEWKGRVEEKEKEGNSDGKLNIPLRASARNDSYCPAPSLKISLYSKYCNVLKINSH